MTDRILSPDGTQFWDGNTWHPVEEHPATPAPPEAAHRAADTNGQPAAAPRQAVLPPPTPAPAATATDGLENSWPVNKWAWRIALSPFIFTGLVWWVVDSDGPDWAYFAVGAVIAIGATFATDRDVRTLKSRDVDAEQAFTAAVLLVYGIGAPAYLIHRTRKARTTPLIPVVWFVGALLSFAPFILGSTAGLNLFDGTDSVNVPGIESSIEDSLKEAGVRGSEVDCPDDASYDEGDMVLCDVTSNSDGDFEIFLNMRNDGYFEWQVQ